MAEEQLEWPSRKTKRKRKNSIEQLQEKQDKIHAKQQLLAAEWTFAEEVTFTSYSSRTGLKQCGGDISSIKIKIRHYTAEIVAYHWTSYWHAITQDEPQTVKVEPLRIQPNYAKIIITKKLVGVCGEYNYPSYRLFLTVFERSGVRRGGKNDNGPDPGEGSSNSGQIVIN